MLSWIIIIFIVLWVLRVNFKSTIDTIYENRESKDETKSKDDRRMNTKEFIDADFKILDEEEDNNDTKE